jgi:crossover junction endodeoxyribonuclease RuvC
MTNPTVLTLDLGTQTGWAIWYGKSYPIIMHREYGVEDFSTKRVEGGGMRYLRFQNWLEKMSRKFHGINEIYFEEVRGHKGTAAAHVYGGFLATLMSWCEERGIPYQGVPVQAIKKFITGKGNSNKQLVIDAVKAQGYDNVEDSNEADAIALMLYIRSRKA